MIVKLLDTTTEFNPNFNFYYIEYDVLTLIPQYLRLSLLFSKISLSLSPHAQWLLPMKLLTSNSVNATEH